MNRKRLIILLAVLGAVTVAAVVAWQVYRVYYPKEEQNVNTHPTDAGLFFDDSTPPADPLIVGHWTNSANPGWHKVYYDDYDEEQCQYWGKEWDESEDVYEADLKYHGNGWFRWKKQDGMLHEFSTMDYRDVPIHRGYKITKSTADSLCYFEAERKSAVLRFAKRN
jgi:hypothetical protein